VAQAGYTALHWASDRGHTSIVEMLMDRGADIHRKNHVRRYDGQTVLLLFDMGIITEIYCS